MREHPLPRAFRAHGARSVDAVKTAREELRPITHAWRFSTPALAWLPALLALGCISVNLPSGQIEPLAETVIDGEGDAKVLMLEVDGVITETSDVADFLGTVNEVMVGRVREELDLARSDDH